jgi:hypothetical protein
MPKPTTKSRQELRSRFVRNAIPTEADFADLIASSINQADDGLLRLPDQSLGVARPKADVPVLRFFADPAAETAVWQMQLIGTDKPGFGLSSPTGPTALFLDGATGNVGIGTDKPTSKLHVQGSMRVDTDLMVQGALSTSGDMGIGTTTLGHKLTVEGISPDTQAPGSDLTRRGIIAIRSNRPQLDFIDTDAEKKDWAIHVNNDKMFFVCSPWASSLMVLDSAGNVGSGTQAPECKLHVVGTAGITGQVDVLRGANPIRITSEWSGFASHSKDAKIDNELTTRNAEIANDTVGFKCLMIAGNKSAGEVDGDRGIRKVAIFDDLYIDRDLHVTRDLTVVRDLTVRGGLLRKVWFATGNGPISDLDNGQIASRVLKVTKKLGARESVLRILYCDNTRLNGDHQYGRWEIRVDGKSLKTPIIADRYHSAGNHHIHGTIMGYARDLAAGACEIQVWIVPIPGASNGDASTGYNNSTWCLEAEEIYL